MIKWVGFDMDECLGSFMPLWPFCELIPEKMGMSDNECNAYLSAIAQRLANTTDLRIFRPGLRALLTALVKAKQAKQIAGCFLLTNNGSWELAEVVRQTLNHMAAHELFVVAWDRYSPCRDGTENPKKDLVTIQSCLAASGLPTLQSTTDLLFYDDQEHVLESEIPHYVRVAAYIHPTPVDLVYNRLKSILDRQEIPLQVRNEVLKEAHRYERLDRTVKATPVVEISPKTFQDFLQSSPLPQTKQTRQTRRGGYSKGKSLRRKRRAKN
jgi:hypothetical protein